MLLMKQNVKWSQFSVSDRMPPSTRDKAAVCFTGPATTCVVLLSVLQ